MDGSTDHSGTPARGDLRMDAMEENSLYPDGRRASPNSDITRMAGGSVGDIPSTVNPTANEEWGNEQTERASYTAFTSVVQAVETNVNFHDEVGERFSPGEVPRRKKRFLEEANWSQKRSQFREEESGPSSDQGEAQTESNDEEKINNEDEIVLEEQQQPRAFSALYPTDYFAENEKHEDECKGQGENFAEREEMGFDQQPLAALSPVERLTRMTGEEHEDECKVEEKRFGEKDETNSEQEQDGAFSEEDPRCNQYPRPPPLYPTSSDIGAEDVLPVREVASSSFDAAPMSEKQWERKRAALDAAARTPGRQAAPLGAHFVPGEAPNEPSVPTPDAVDRPVSNPSTPGVVSVPGRAPGNFPAWGRRVRAMGSLVSNRRASRLSRRGSRNGSSAAVIVEATLVNEHNNGDEAEEEGVVPSAAVARPLKCGINFGDRRVRLVLVLVVLAFIGLVAALGVSLSGEADDESTTATTDNEIYAVESTLRPTTTPSTDPRESMLSPTAIAGSSSSPTTAPTSLPSGTPTMAPTYWAWKEIMRFQGVLAEGMFGSTVMMSAKGNRLAVAYKKQQVMCDIGRNRALRNAATKRDLACQTSTFFVEVFEQNATDSVEWTFMGRGSSIEGFELEKNAAVALSGNGERVAIVSPSGSGVYTVRDTDQSNAFSRVHFRFSVDEASEVDVALSHDGDVVAVAQPGSDSGNGKVEVTKHEEECFLAPPNFTLCKASMSVEAILGGPGLSSFGETLSLSSSGSVMACGGSKGNASVVQVYENLSETWSPMGTEIEAKAIPSSTSLSADGRRIALGGSDLPQTLTELNPGDRFGEGEARVLDYNATTEQWTQVGDSIKTGTMGQNNVAVSLSGDGTTLAVGARSSDADGFGSGVTRVYQFDGVSWTQIGMDIYDRGGDNLGASVSLSGDGRHVVVGAPNNRDAGPDAGAAMVYEMTSLHR